jgi:hypothetical protein
MKDPNEQVLLALPRAGESGSQATHQNCPHPQTPTGLAACWGLDCALPLRGNGLTSPVIRLLALRLNQQAARLFGV